MEWPARPGIGTVWSGETSAVARAAVPGYRFPVMTDDDKRRERMYRLGRAAGRQFRPGAPGREAVRRLGGSLLRRGLFRLLRRF